MQENLVRGVRSLPPQTKNPTYGPVICQSDDICLTIICYKYYDLLEVMEDPTKKLKSASFEHQKVPYM